MSSGANNDSAKDSEDKNDKEDGDNDEEDEDDDDDVPDLVENFDEASKGETVVQGNSKNSFSHILIESLFKISKMDYLRTLKSLNFAWNLQVPQ